MTAQRADGPLGTGALVSEPDFFEDAAVRDTRRRTGGPRATPVFTAMVLGLGHLVCGCSEELDAGSTRPFGQLPVDARNPILITNDGPTDNWQGEYAMLLANGGGPKLAGIVVSASFPWPDLDANVTGWRQLVAAARESGLRGIPDPIASVSAALVRPASGEIEDTVPNRSEGALFILEQAEQLALPYRPLVIATGGGLTDIANAYLIDPTVTDKVVVVSSLGTASDAGGFMGRPNGELDGWASAIVGSRFRYVQVNAYYDQLTVVPASRIPELPSNALGAWIAAKQPGIFELNEASDQISVIAAGLTGFAVGVQRVSPGPLRSDSLGGPDLELDPEGPAWLVREGASALATARFWELLLDPETFSD